MSVVYQSNRNNLARSTENNTIPGTIDALGTNLIRGDGDHLDQVPVAYACIILIHAY